METKGSLHPLLDETFASFFAVLERERNVPALREVGIVRSITGSIVVVEGLPGARSDEILLFADDVPGLVFDLDRDTLGAVLLGKSDRIRSGTRVRRTGRVQDVPVGEELLGRVIDPTGRALDERGPIRGRLRRSVEREAPPIMDRAPVTIPLQTGVKVVDSLIPIGRGQRELILGDRQTGKTTLALDVILNQRDQNVLCIYCAIGQRASSVARVVSELREHDCMDYTIVVASGSDDSPALQFLAPYAATSIGEYFMERGRDVLVVYDDLTRHAHAYRELSLLLRRPPGREAYPGDIFYIHSRLLERSAHLGSDRGGGSLTALPVVETQAQDLAAYIPTNLISITDGQIYLSPDLFQKGVLPAVDVERSVSRVGGKTQLPAYRAVAGDLKLSYSQFHELEAFARFGTRLDSETKRILDRGHRVREIFKQSSSSPLPVEEQILVLLAVTEGILDDPEIHLMEEAERLIRSEMRLELDNPAKSDLKQLREAILSGSALDGRGRNLLLEIARRSVEKLLARREAQKSR